MRLPSADFSILVSTMRANVRLDALLPHGTSRLLTTAHTTRDDDRCEAS